MPKIKVKRFKQENAHRQKDGHTHIHGRYQTYYLPCYAVNKKVIEAVLTTFVVSAKSMYTGPGGATGEGYRFGM